MIEREEHGGATILRLQHGRAHALDLELLVGLEGALAEELRNGRPIVLTGGGKAFSAGVDLVRMLDEGAQYTTAFLSALDALLERLYCFPRPVIAAVNGHAIAGGCVLACACDHRIAARGGLKLGLPELRVGVPFPQLALEVVRAVLSPAAFREVVLFGRYHGAEEALAIGLVDELVEADALLPRAVALAEELAAIPAASYAQHKRSMSMPVLAHRAAEDQRALDVIWSSEEVRDAIRAYVAATLRK